MYDLDGNGLIKLSELRQVLTTIGDKMTNDEFDESFGDDDCCDSEGYFDYKKYVRKVVLNPDYNIN